MFKHYKTRIFIGDAFMVMVLFSPLVALFALEVYAIFN
jgi:hypothetical protein